MLLYVLQKKMSNEAKDMYKLAILNNDQDTVEQIIKTIGEKNYSKIISDATK